MVFDNNTFDIEIYCSICGSNNVEFNYDKDDNCVNVTCECGNKDTLIIDD